MDVYIIMISLYKHTYIYSKCLKKYISYKEHLEKRVLEVGPIKIMPQNNQVLFVKLLKTMTEEIRCSLLPFGLCFVPPSNSHNQDDPKIDKNNKRHVNVN